MWSSTCDLDESPIGRTGAPVVLTLMIAQSRPVPAVPICWIS